MKIVVLGAGVIGVTSAWYLAKAGHEVTVIDRQPAPALETSFANAGEVSPGYSAPWAAPGIPVKAMKWLFMKHAPLIIGPRPSLAKIEWVTRMLGNCNSRSYAINKSRMVRLAEYSRDCLIDLRVDDRASLRKNLVLSRDGGVQQQRLAGFIPFLRAHSVAHVRIDILRLHQ